MERYSFRAPGADHHARWMAKQIYGFKILLFREQFKLSKREEEGLRTFCIYATRFHIKAWFTANNAIQAPNHDLYFLKSLQELKKFDKEVASIAIKKFCNHLWYLGDETVSHAFFDSNVSLDQKRKMANVLLEYMCESNVEESPVVKKYPLKPTDIERFCKMELCDFISPNSIIFFERFEIATSFLSMDPST